MYQGTSTISGLPAAGVGTAAVGMTAGDISMMSMMILFLALWTLIAAGKAIWRMRPVTEV